MLWPGAHRIDITALRTYSAGLHSWEPRLRQRFTNSLWYHEGQDSLYRTASVFVQRVLSYGLYGD